MDFSDFQKSDWVVLVLPSDFENEIEQKAGHIRASVTKELSNHKLNSFD